MEKCEIMCLSTSCISPETAGKLNECAFKGAVLASNMPIYQMGVCGWFIPVVDSFESEIVIADDLKDCMLYAKANNCDWLSFDREVEYDKSDGLLWHKW